MENNKIWNLDMLRVIGAGFIFINHVWAFLPFPIPDFGARGVELFFIMSGLLLSYNHYYDFCERPSTKECILFAVERIKKYYALHLLTLLAMGYIQVNYLDGIEFPIRKAIASMLLIQSWIPNSQYYTVYNGVAWFLSSILFCYFVFPKSIHFYKRTIRNNYLIAIFLFFLFYLYLLLWGGVRKLEVPNQDWLLYIFPIYRVFQFEMGVLLGLLAKKLDKSISGIKTSLVVLGYLIVFLVCDKVCEAPLFFAIELFFVFMLVSIDREKSSFEKLLFGSLSSISFDFYLIHHVVVIYYGVFNSYFYNLVKIDRNWIIDVITILTVSLLLSVISYFVRNEAKHVTRFMAWKGMQ